MLERELDEVRRLGLDPEDRPGAHRERRADVALRDAVDHLERRVAVDRLDDTAADLRVAVRVLLVDHGERDARVAREVPCLARAGLREERDPAVLEDRPYRNRMRRAVGQQRREVHDVAPLGEERRDARIYRNAFSPVSALPMTSVCTSWVPSYVRTDSRLLMWRITGYSSVIPLPPRIVRALRATSIAPRTLPILPRLTCSGRSVPSSFMRPRCSATSVPRFSSSAISASFCCVSW